MTACLVSAEKTRRKTRWRCSAFSCAVSPFLCVHVDVSRTVAAGVSLKHSLPSSEAVIEAWSKNGFSNKKRKKKVLSVGTHHFLTLRSLFFLIFVSFESCWPGRWQTLFSGNTDDIFVLKEIQTEISSRKSCSSTLKNLQPDPFQAWFEYGLGQSPHFRWKEKFALRLIGEATYRRRSCPLINNMRNVNEHIRATATQITTGCNQDFFFFSCLHTTLSTSKVYLNKVVGECILYIMGTWNI